MVSFWNWFDHKFYIVSIVYKYLRQSGNKRIVKVKFYTWATVIRAIKLETNEPGNIMSKLLIFVVVALFVFTMYLSYTTADCQRSETEVNEEIQFYFAERKLTFNTELVYTEQWLLFGFLRWWHVRRRWWLYNIKLERSSHWPWIVCNRSDTLLTRYNKRKTKIFVVRSVYASKEKLCYVDDVSNTQRT